VSTPETFLIAMTIIFIVPWLLWRFGNMDYAPLVVVQIIAGILLGPGILGRALPDYYPSSSIRPSCSRSTASPGGR
jgi:Kef-type K+ transport system membrane component KefB